GSVVRGVDIGAVWSSPWLGYGRRAVRGCDDTMRRQLRRQDERTPLTDPAGRSPGPGRSRRARRGGRLIVVAAVGVLAVVAGGILAWRADRLPSLGSLFAQAATPPPRSCCPRAHPVSPAP